MYILSARFPKTISYQRLLVVMVQPAQVYISVFTHVMHLLDENQPIWNLELTFLENEMKTPSMSVYPLKETETNAVLPNVLRPVR